MVSQQRTVCWSREAVDAQVGSFKVLVVSSLSAGSHTSKRVRSRDVQHLRLGHRQKLLGARGCGLRKP